MPNQATSDSLPVIEIQLVPAGELCLGMRGSQLDRPWDETPFLFQGFLIDSEEMRDPGASRPLLRELRDVGIRIAIDDFGTGYSSLSYFKSIPADELKIVRAVLDLAKGFGLSVTAEGVEDEATARRLHELGCDTLQGYHHARPMPQRELLAWLQRQSRPRSDSPAVPISDRPPRNAPA